MIGLGTQDDLEYAQRFQKRTGVKHRLLWDPGFDSWAALRIATQPSAMLFSADGRELKRWSGLFDEGEVLTVLAGQPAPTEKVVTAEEFNQSVSRFCRYASRFDQAQRQLEAVFGGADGEAKRAGDDNTFAANGMAQFAEWTNAGPEFVVGTRDLAATANELRSLLFDAKDGNAITAIAEGDVVRRQRENTSKLVATVNTTCGVTIVALR